MELPRHNKIGQMLPLSHLLYALFMTAWLCPYVLDVINQESYNALGRDTYCSLFSQRGKEESGLPHDFLSLFLCFS